MKNLSQYKPSPSELNILSKGANFAISLSEIPIKEYIAQNKTCLFWSWSVKPTVLELEYEVKLYVPKPRNWKVESEGIKSLQTVIKDKEVLILSQEKGRAIVLEDPKMCEKKLRLILDPLNIEEDIP